jgi:hypothetical protein
MLSGCAVCATAALLAPSTEAATIADIFLESITLSQLEF